ncbi:unnamed protein product [Spirodela intermedia]|uniref:Uncharacterized protein n=2 Tax=Spirodela intermedia TaxID=51605 RepID=A0A7I8KG37_SPIIN|nr:unnamed protein product [Spirodela intermedia]CAA6660394.1 unnamed protein product [Spirodela intermedia]CAA7396739.1 unnamed protein product [Spirodela intermedia]
MDDFSFPTLAMDADSLCQLPFPHFAASPLWFLSSASDERAVARSVSSSEDAGRDAVREEDPGSAAASDGGAADGPPASEKMDQLWEDFNEELAWLSYRQMEAEGKFSADDSAPVFWLVDSKPRKTKVGLRALRRTDSGGSISTTGSGMVHHQSPGLVAALKLMKRVLLMKTRHCDEQHSHR